MTANSEPWLNVKAHGTLPLALASWPGRSRPIIAILGVTMQHVIVQLRARAASKTFITGPRANVAGSAASQFNSHHTIKSHAEIEIELAIPTLLGLGSTSIMLLAVARALAQLNGLPTHDISALGQAIDLQLPGAELEMAGFQVGGLLLVEINGEHGSYPNIMRRHELRHDDLNSWAIPMLQALPESNTPPDLERNNYRNLVEAGAHLNLESGYLFDKYLWPAVVSDDYPGFTHALSMLQTLTLRALQDAGTPTVLSEFEQSVLSNLREAGASATAQSLFGLTLFGFTQGNKNTAKAKRSLMAHVGHEAGSTIATLTNNSGASLTTI